MNRRGNRARPRAVRATRAPRCRAGTHRCVLVVRPLPLATRSNPPGPKARDLPPERCSAKGGGCERAEPRIPHRTQSPPEAGLLVPSNHGFTLACPKDLPVAPNAPHLGAGYFKGVPLKPLLLTRPKEGSAATRPSLAFPRCNPCRSQFGATDTEASAARSGNSVPPPLTIPRLASHRSRSGCPIPTPRVHTLGPRSPLLESELPT